MWKVVFLNLISKFNMFHNPYVGFVLNIFTYSDT